MYPWLPPPPPTTLLSPVIVGLPITETEKTVNGKRKKVVSLGTRLVEQPIEAFVAVGDMHPQEREQLKAWLDDSDMGSWFDGVDDVG